MTDKFALIVLEHRDGARVILFAEEARSDLLVHRVDKDGIQDR